MTRASTTRVYASSKSAWTDFATAYDKLMDACVRQKGTGGAYFVPRMSLRFPPFSPSPPPSFSSHEEPLTLTCHPFFHHFIANGKLTDSSLVIYFYTQGSFFDYQLNEYMTRPYGINPATLPTDFLQQNVSTTPPAVDTA